MLKQLTNVDCPFKRESAPILEFKRAAKKYCEECHVTWQIWQRFRNQKSLISVADEDIITTIRHRRFTTDDYTINLLQQVKSPETGRIIDILLTNQIVRFDLRVSIHFARKTSLQGSELAIPMRTESFHCAVAEPNFQPCRLIDVGNRLFHPFLTENPVDGYLYAVLSYCWGPISCAFATNRRNLDQHFQKIEFSMLSKSIKDAIVVCRCLNIRYLWIDALCIIQNDVDDRDWYEQSLHMGSIYSNAHLVISVDEAARSDSGFLPPEVIYSWERVHTRDTGSTRNIRLIRQTHIDEDKQTLCGTTSLQTLPLSSRGWSMQECILPQRVLHFAKRELIWECNTTRNCECRRPKVHGLWKDYNYGLINDPHNKPDDERDSVHVLDFLQGKSGDSICWVWERLIELYSKRSLTVAGDKLAALSGLAEHFQKRLKIHPADFYAGIWDINFPVRLLWYVSGAPVSSRPRDWRAPTWSWAALDGGIKFFHEHYQFRFTSSIRVVEMVCEPISVDLLGKVKRAHIKLQGYLTAVNLNITAQTGEYEGQFQGYSGKPSRAFQNQVAEVRRKSGGSLSFEVLPDLQIDVGTYDTDIYCLELGQHDNKLRLGERTWWLLLRKTTSDYYSEAFERIGLGVYDSYKSDMSLFKQADARHTQEIVLI